MLRNSSWHTLKQGVVQLITPEQMTRTALPSRSQHRLYNNNTHRSLLRLNVLLYYHGVYVHLWKTLRNLKIHWDGCLSWINANLVITIDFGHNKQLTWCNQHDSMVCHLLWNKFHSFHPWTLDTHNILNMKHAILNLVRHVVKSHLLLMTCSHDKFVET